MSQSHQLDVQCLLATKSFRTSATEFYWFCRKIMRVASTMGQITSSLYANARFRKVQSNEVSGGGKESHARSKHPSVSAISNRGAFGNGNLYKRVVMCE